jgi:putative membrane protein
MGAADVVPGVSGGTIAFVAGIYEELITTIDRIDFGIFKMWKKEGFKAMFAHYNLGFLVSLFLGVFISILSLAQLIEYLLDNHPIVVWSFFFGLVIASILFIGKQIKKWTLAVILAVIIGAVIAYYITVAIPGTAPDVWYYFMLSGFIAIIAMILPGVSGSFILVLLGSYELILGTLNDFISGISAGDWGLVKTSFLKVLLFIIGCVIGLKLFSKGLKWMFTHKKELTLAVLTGFMIGSLNKIWPWKEILSTRIDRHGEEVPLLERSILPNSFDGDALVMNAVIAAIIGFALILILERAAGEKKVHAD